MNVRTVLRLLFIYKACRAQVDESTTQIESDAAIESSGNNDEESDPEIESFGNEDDSFDDIDDAFDETCLDEEDWGGFNLDEKDTSCATWNGRDCESVSWKIGDGDRAKLINSCRKSCRMCGSKKLSKRPLIEKPADCMNDKDFEDAKGWVCEQWDGFHCELATELYDFTQQQQDDLLENCRLACKICEHDFNHLQAPSSCKFPFLLPKRGVIKSCEETAGYSPYTLSPDEVWKDFDRLWCPTTLDADAIYKENQPFRMCYREKFNLLYDHQPCQNAKDCFSENCEEIEGTKRCIQKKSNVCSTRQDNARERCPEGSVCNKNGSWKGGLRSDSVTGPCIKEDEQLKQHDIADETRNICVGQTKTKKCEVGEICLPLVPEVCSESPDNRTADKAIWLIVLISIFCTIFLLIIGLFFCHYMTKGLKKKYLNLGDLLEDDDRKKQIRRRLAWLRAGKILDHGMIPKRSSLPTYGIDKPIEIGRRASDQTEITVPKSWTFGGTDGAASQCASTWINGYKPGENGTIGNGKAMSITGSSVKGGATVYSVPQNMGRVSMSQKDCGRSAKTYAAPRSSITQSSRSRHYRHPYKDIQIPSRPITKEENPNEDDNKSRLFYTFDSHLPPKEKVLPLETVLQRITKADIPGSSQDDEKVSSSPKKSENEKEEEISVILEKDSRWSEQDSKIDISSTHSQSKISFHSEKGRIGVTMTSTMEITLPTGDDVIDMISFDDDMDIPDEKISAVPKSVTISAHDLLADGHDLEMGVMEPEISEFGMSDVSRDLDSASEGIQNFSSSMPLSDSCREDTEKMTYVEDIENGGE